jgi:cytochrome P450
MSEAAGVEPRRVYFNPFDPEFRANPHQHYRALLAGPPRILKLFIPVALVARYADVVAVLHDWERFSSERPKAMLINEGYGSVQNMLTMLLSDPPVHTRIRRAVAGQFVPKRMKDLEPRIREITKGLLDAVERKGEFDVVADLADHLPVMVLAELLAVPREQYPQFKRWSDLITDAPHIMPGVPLPDQIREAFTEIREYFARKVDEKRRQPGNEMLSALAAAEDADKLTTDELLDFVILLLLAGTDTTTNMIGNGFLALGRHPEEMAMLKREPSIVERALEEMLRYDGPIQATPRYLKADAEVGGTKFEKGTMAFVVLAAANRDPAQFKDPDRFDITRHPNAHVAFGYGIHFCVGAPLGRLEGQIALNMTLERFPNLRLADPDAPQTYKDFYFLRGLRDLKMEI